MASRRDYYYRQTLSESELDASFAALELADQALASDALPVGVVRGAVVTQHGAPQNLTVDVSGQAAIYDAAGQRIAFSALQNVSIALDHLGVSTSVAGGGNEKFVSVFIRFDRALSDPRVDGNGATVYFVREESFEWYIVQGAEAAIGMAVPPALDADSILLADVHLVQGQTQVLNADISTTRRQAAVKRTGATWALDRGVLEDAVYDLLDALNAHVAGTGDHSSSDVVWTGGGSAWYDTTANPQTTVTAQLAKVITDLIATAADHSGAHRVGCGARTSWINGRTNAAITSVFGAIDKIITDLIDRTADDDGAERVGAGASAGSPYTMAEGSVRSQLNNLLAAINGHASLGDTDKHIVVEDSCNLGGWSVETTVNSAGYMDTAATITLAELKNGDVVHIDGAVNLENSAAGLPYVHLLASLGGGGTAEVPGTEVALDSMFTAGNMCRFPVCGRYPITVNGSYTFTLQGKCNANNFALIGGSTLRATVIR